MKKKHVPMIGNVYWTWINFNKCWLSTGVIFGFFKDQVSTKVINKDFTKRSGIETFLKTMLSNLFFLAHFGKTQMNKHF